MDVVPLRGIWAPASHHDGSSYCDGFKNWLSKDDFYIDSVDSNKKFILAIRNPQMWKTAMASDCIRIGINALQSLHSIRSSACFPKIGAWHLIQAYYAAFFAAHSTLRLFGRPFSYFEQGHSKQISDRANSESVCHNAALCKGNYAGVYDSNNHSIEFTYKSDSHKDLWATYVHFLRKISLQVLEERGLQKDLTEASQELDNIAEMLCRNKRYPNGNWLSIVRNEVNYKSPPSVWFPFAKNKTASDTLFDSLREWRSNKYNSLNCMNKKTEYEQYFATCLLVVHLTSNLLDDYVSISTNGCRSATLYGRFSNLSKSTFEV